MSFELERLEDRLAPTTLPAAPPDAAPLPPAAAEALLDPLRNRLGPRQEDTAPRVPALASHAAPPAVTLAGLTDLDDPDVGPDAGPDDEPPADRPTPEISDLAIQADLADRASPPADKA